MEAGSVSTPERDSAYAYSDPRPAIPLVDYMGSVRGSIPVHNHFAAHESVLSCAKEDANEGDTNQRKFYVRCQRFFPH